MRYIKQDPFFFEKPRCTKFSVMSFQTKLSYWNTKKHRNECSINANEENRSSKLHFIVKFDIVGFAQKKWILLYVPHNSKKFFLCGQNLSIITV